MTGPAMTAKISGADGSNVVPGRRSDTIAAFALGLPVLFFLLVIVAYPMGYAFWMSLHKVLFFGGYRTTFIGLANYAKIFSDKDFWWATWVSVRFTVETVILTMALGVLLGLLLHRLKGRKLLRTLIFLPWCISPYAAGLMFAYLAKGQTGIGTAISYALGYNETIGFMSRSMIIEVLALGNAWTMAPLVAFFVVANLKTIPVRLYHLAAIDRLNSLETFFYVTLPPLRFSLFVFTAVTTTLAMKLFDFIFVLSGGGPGNASSVLTYEIYKTSYKESDFGYGAAMSFFLLFFTLALTFVLYLVWGRKEQEA